MHDATSRAPIPTPSSRACSARKRRPGAASSRSSSAPPPASARPTPCWRRRARRKARGVDVVVGYVEPHGRAETEALLEGLERLPYLHVAYRGATLRDFDLDAALARKPALLLVDELAHSNPVEGEPAPRHAKRWQDVEELLAAGIDVYTTVNVQHIESLNDIVAGITGVRMQETVPDLVFESARRGGAGRHAARRAARAAARRQGVHPGAGAARHRQLLPQGQPDRAARARAAHHRRPRGRGDAGVPRRPRHPRHLGGGRAHPGRVGPDEQAERLVRAGKRMATALHAAWIVVYVETPDLLRLPEAERNRRIALLRLAESLGAEAVTLGGSSAGEEIANYAATRNVTRIVIGRPRRAAVAAPVPALHLRRAARSAPQGIDLHVVGGADEAAVAAQPVPRAQPGLPRHRAAERQAALARLRLGASRPPPPARCSAWRCRRPSSWSTSRWCTCSRWRCSPRATGAARRSPPRCSAWPRSISSSCRRSSPSR